MPVHRRTLADWYPDTAERRRLSYSFAHEFLPTLVHRVDVAQLRDRLSGAPQYADILIANLWKQMTQALGLPPVLGIIRIGPFDSPEGLAHTAIGLDAEACTVEGRPAVLLRFPLPEDAPHASRALIVRGPAAAHALRYFTLERTLASEHPPIAQSDPHAQPEMLGVVCEWSASHTHRNFGVAIRISDAADEPFRALCADIIAGRGPEPAMESAANPDSPRGRTYTVPMRPGRSPDDPGVLE